MRALQKEKSSPEKEKLNELLRTSLQIFDRERISKQYIPAVTFYLFLQAWLLLIYI